MYDNFELADLVVRLKEQLPSTLAPSNKDNISQLITILTKNECHWNRITEYIHAIETTYPEFFTNFSDIPLYIGQEKDNVTSIIIKWRFDLGK
jgi:hypothetical protein